MAILHNKVLHDRVVLMTIRTSDVPFAPENERIDLEELGQGFYRVLVHYGFMDELDVPHALDLFRARNLEVDLMLTSYFLGRETLIPSTRPGMGPIEEQVFTLMSAGNLQATTYFGIPTEQVVELGTQVEL
jgi:KUP system potassium uptake protein